MLLRKIQTFRIFTALLLPLRLLPEKIRTIQRHEKLKESLGNSTEKILRLIPNSVCRTLRSLNFPIYARTYTRLPNVSS